MRRSLLLVALWVALSCTPKHPASGPTPANPPGAPLPPPPPPPPPPGPPPSSSQAIRLGPSALRYVMHQIIHVDQQLPTGPQKLDYGLQIFFGATVTGPADTAGYPTTITVDSMVPDSGTNAPMGINLSAGKGLSFGGRLSRTGEFRTQTISDSAAAQSLSPVLGTFKNFFPRLPASGVTLGATWTDTTTENDRAAGSVTVVSVNRAHAAAWDQRNNTRALRIEINSEFTIKGSGEQAGQQYDVAGTGLHTGTDFLAADGRYLGGEARDSTSMTITLPVQTMTIPRTQVSKTTVTVLP